MTLWLAKQEFKNKKCKPGQLINYCIKKNFVENYTENVP